MSFSFSVGDFLAAATLIKDVISALNGTVALEYRELELELHGLQRALEEIEQLKSSPEQEIDINAVKVVALMCWRPLKEFHSKLRRYETLSDMSPHKKRDMVKGWSRKVQRHFCMEKLHASIAMHVGSLNKRLTTLGLTTMVIAKTEAPERDDIFHDALEA